MHALPTETLTIVVERQYWRQFAKCDSTPTVVEDFLTT